MTLNQTPPPLKFSAYATGPESLFETLTPNMFQNFQSVSGNFSNLRTRYTGGTNSLLSKPNFTLDVQTLAL